MSLPILCETDATSMETRAQPNGDRSAPRPVEPASVRPPTRDTEVLLLGLKPNSSYNATIYSQAADGTQGQPLHVDFQTGMLEFASARLSSTEVFVFCDCGSEFSLASQAVLRSEGVFWKRCWRFFLARGPATSFLELGSARLLPHIRLVSLCIGPGTSWGHPFLWWTDARLVSVS